MKANVSGAVYSNTWKNHEPVDAVYQLRQFAEKLDSAIVSMTRKGVAIANVEIKITSPNFGYSQAVAIINGTITAD